MTILATSTLLICYVRLKSMWLIHQAKVDICSPVGGVIAKQFDEVLTFANLAEQNPESDYVLLVNSVPSRPSLGHIISDCDQG